MIQDPLKTLPEGQRGVDLVLALGLERRQHTTIEGLSRAIKRWRRPPVSTRFLLASYQPAWLPPSNLPLGWVAAQKGGARLNLQLPPFELRAPLCWQYAQGGTYLALFDLKRLQGADHF